MLYWHPDFPYKYRRPKAIKRFWRAERGYYVRLARYSAGVLTLATLAGLNIALLHTAKAYTQYSAIDNIGQTHGTHSSPVYTEDNANDTPRGNPTGINSPGQMAIDTTGHHLFLADGGNHRVMVYNLDNNNRMVSATADNAIGQAGFATSDLDPALGNCNTATPTQSNMCFATGVAYDPVNKYLFVSDNWWDRIMVYDLSGGISNDMTASFELGQTDFSTKSCGGRSQSSLCQVDDLTYNSSAQQLFAGDGDRVMVFDLSGGITDGMNASHVLGRPDFTTNSGCQAFGATPTQDHLCSSHGLAFDAAGQRLFVADSYWNRISVFDLSGGITNGMNAASEIGQPDFTSTTNSGTGCSSGPVPSQANLCVPEGVDYDAANQRLFVSDSDSNREMVFDLSGGITNGMNANRVLGQANFTDNSSTCLAVASSQSSLCRPAGGIFDPTNSTLFVSDSGDSRLMEYDLSGGISNGMNALDEAGQVDYLGNHSFTLTWNDNANPNPYGFSSPTGITEDTVNHRMFVADEDNKRVLVFNLDNSNHFVDRQADFVLGQPDFVSGALNCSNETSAAQNRLCDPTAVVYDANHDYLFVTDFSPASRVLVYDLSGGITNGMNASWVLGQANFTDIDCNHGVTPTSASVLCDPDGLAYDTNHDRLYVADNGNDRVVMYEMSGGITSGMAAAHELGQPDINSWGCDNPTENASSQCTTNDVAYDNGTDQLFVADGGNVRVLEYDMSGTITDGMAATHVIGQTNFTGFQCHLNQAGMCGVVDVEVDSVSHRLFVEDDWYNRVTEYNLFDGITDGMNASVALGVADFTHVGGDTTRTTFAFGWSGMNFDPTTGKLYASDYFNNRVMVFDIAMTITTTALPTGQNGSPYSATVDIQDPAGTPSYTISGGSLPPGLSIDSGTGVISGTPTAEGNFPFTVQVDDEAGGTVSANLSIAVTHPYAASDLLGQVDGGGVPIWGQGAVNNNGSVGAEGLNYPNSTAMDTIRHRLFVADGNNRVIVYNLDANNVLIDHTADYVLGQPNMTGGGDNANCDWNGGTPSANNMCSPEGISFDETDNRLFVPDNYESRVLVFDFSGGISDGMAASHVLGQSNPGSFGCATTQAGLCNPWGGSVYDPLSDYLYVSDLGNHRLMIYDLSSGISDGMNAAHVIGEPNFTTAGNWGNLPTQSNVIGINGLTLDSAGHRLFVADWNDGGRVMVFNTNSISDGMAADNVLGETDFTSFDSASDNGDPPDAKSFGPTGLAFDSKHNLLFVSDDNDYREMVFDTSAIVDNEDAVGVLGQLDFISNDTSCTTSQASLCDPEGADQYYDTANERLYLADSGNNRVMIYDFARLFASAPAGTVGSAYSFNSNAHSQGTTAFSLASGSLPNGIVLNSSSGLLSGTPTASGTFNFAVHLADDNSTPGTFIDDKNYSLTINPGGGGDSQAPTVPAGVNVTGTTTSTISLSWTASVDNVAVQGYNIYRDGGGSPIASTASTSFTDSGLSPGTTHTYTVTAYDAASNESGHSGQVSGSTQSSGSSGGSAGGSSGSGSSSGGITKHTSPPAAEPAPGNINLDSQPGFSDGSGYTQDSPSGQTFTFSDSDGQQHTITVQQVDDGSSVLAVDSSTMTLNTGGSEERDVNNDGHSDIGITLNKVDGGKADLTFKKIVFAVAPGGQTASGFGAGNTQGPSARKHHPSRILEIAVNVFPWLLFALLGLSAVRLLYQAYQERRAAGLINRQLELEKMLGEEKHNFITLSSHYFRTPLTAITNGIELLAGTGALTDPEQLKSLSSRLSQDVNSLLANATYGRTEETQAQPYTGLITPAGRLAASAGFIQISTMRAMSLVLGGGYAIALISYFIINKTDVSNLSLINLFTQLAAMLLASVLLVAGIRSHNKHKQIRENNENLLVEKQRLESQRNQIVRQSLYSLKDPLDKLKSAMQSAHPSNPKIAQPALNGIAQLEALLNKFMIVTSLETKTMPARRQAVDVSDLITRQINGYSQALQNRGLKIRYSQQPLPAQEDPLLLSFVISSLLSNAVKYSPEGGQIEVSASKTPTGVNVIVTDHGAGVDKSKAEELFKPFSRAEDSAQDFSVQGIGLSLYLDKLVMDFLGGQISLNSSDGSTNAVITI